MKIVTVVGARPQFIKSVMLSRALAEFSAIEEIVIHTGQHYDANMSDIFFEELAITPPRFNLGVGGGTHGQNTGRMIEKIEKILISINPECVLVYGDTDSTLACAIASSKLGMPLIHVEAGLRSFNRHMPEEINRVLTDHTAEVLYAPSTNAVRNLHHEGIAPDKVMLSGDVMLDAVLSYKAVADKKSTVLERLRILPNEYLFMTLHREENTTDRSTLDRLIRAFAKSARPVIFPVHPRTAKCLRDFKIELPLSVIPIEPLGYLDSIRLISSASLVLTDSGGIQKEAFFLRRPCVTLRSETEWIELVECGANLLAGSDAELIETSLTTRVFPPCAPAIYGTGSASTDIARDIAFRFGKGA